MIPYIGGKYNQTKWMDTHKPLNFSEYAEVFGGAMWFYFKGKIQPQRAYYNDIDPLMVNLFTCFKYYDEMIERLKDLPTYDNNVFQKMKKVIQNNAKKEIKKLNFDFAVAHCYIIAHIFSAFTKNIWSPNLNMVKKRPGSVNYMGDHAIVKRLKDPEIRKKLDILKITNLSYEDFIPKLDNENLFLYVDPPYWKTETYYRKGDFNSNDHIKMIKILKNCKSKWMISYYDFPELHEWLSESTYTWKRKSYMKASGNVKKGKNKNPGEEIIIMNYNNKKDPLNLFFK